MDKKERRGSGGCGDNTANNANTANTTGGDDTSSEFPGVAKSIGFKEFWPYLQRLWSSMATEVASSASSAATAAAAAAVMYPGVEMLIQQHVDAFLSGEVGASEGPKRYRHHHHHHCRHHRRRRGKHRQQRLRKQGRRVRGGQLCWHNVWSS